MTTIQHQSHTDFPIISRTRFFIVSDGRTGTTLLASILGRAGADFGFPIVRKWDPTRGANEHKEFMPLTRTLKKSVFLQEYSTKVPFLRLASKIYESIGKSHTRRLLCKGVYHKSSAHMPAYACKVKYDPRVIASFRRFDETAISKMVFQLKGYPEVATRIEDTYRNAIIGIHTFGGCAIDYDDLMDPEATNWAESLSAVTGLEYLDLMAARTEITKPRTPSSSPKFCLDPKLDALYEELLDIKKAAVPPSQQYLNHRFLEAKKLSEQEATAV